MISARAIFTSLVCGAALLAAVVAVATRGASPPTEWKGVQFAGCTAVIRTTRVACEVPSSGHLRLWAPAASSTAIYTSTDRGAIPLDATTETEGGSAFEITVQADATVLRVASESGQRWSLALTRGAPRPWAEEIAQLRDSGQLDEARTHLITLLAGPAQGVDRARAEGLLARTELARSDYEAALTHFQSAIMLDRANGLLSSEAEDAFALSFVLDQRLHRYAEARAALANAAEAIQLYPEGNARLPFYEGVLLEDTADLHSALQHFEEARRRAERLGMKRPRRNAETSYALELAATGARREALTRLRALADTSSDGLPCDHAAILEAIGIWTLRSLSDGDAEDAASKISLSAAKDAFRTAAALYPRACADAHRHSAVLLGLAEVALRARDFGEAHAQLLEARQGLRTPARLLDVFDVEGRLALAENDPRAALAAYDAQRRAAGETLPPDLGYANAVGRGEALEALGRDSEALAHYETAEVLLDAQSLWIPLSSGRLTFLADRERSARNRIDLLLRLGRAPEAMAAARVSRVRAIAMFEHGERLETLDTEQRARWETSLASYRQLRDRLEARAEEDWKLPTDGAVREHAQRDALEAQVRLAIDAAFASVAQSASPSAIARAITPTRPDETVLAYHPVRNGWVGFAQRGETITTFRFALPPPGSTPELIAERILAPAHAALQASTRVHVLPCGALHAFDVHTLPWGGAMLMDHAIVTYGIDRASRAATDHGRRALIVTDPNENLAGTLDEARLVEKAIDEADGWSTTSLVRDDATSQRVREALVSASWFHYAGHGTFDARLGLASALLLANGTRLTVGDVLALPSVPANVVLAGCDTGRSGGVGAAEGLGMAQAFVAAGARIAIAPVRPVRDEAAAMLVPLLYRSFASDEPDLASALRDAQIAMRDAALAGDARNTAIDARAPKADWAAFRAVTP